MWYATNNKQAQQQQGCGRNVMFVDASDEEGIDKCLPNRWRHLLLPGLRIFGSCSPPSLESYMRAGHRAKVDLYDLNSRAYRRTDGMMEKLRDDRTQSTETLFTLCSLPPKPASCLFGFSRRKIDESNRTGRNFDLLLTT